MAFVPFKRDPASVLASLQVERDSELCGRIVFAFKEHCTPAALRRKPGSWAMRAEPPATFWRRAARTVPGARGRHVHAGIAAALRVAQLSIEIEDARVRPIGHGGAWLIVRPDGKRERFTDESSARAALAKEARAEAPLTARMKRARVANHTVVAAILFEHGCASEPDWCRYQNQVRRAAQELRASQSARAAGK